MDDDRGFFISSTTHSKCFSIQNPPITFLAKFHLNMGLSLRCSLLETTDHSLGGLSQNIEIRAITSLHARLDLCPPLRHP
jgi:hypothetical protein